MDGFGESLFALQTGINSLLAILTRFGAGGASKSVTIMNAALGDVACSDAAFAGNPGAILAACPSPKDMADYFGTAGVLLAPLAATGGLAAFFASEFQGLHDTLTGEDRYTILIKNAVSFPVQAACTAQALAGPAHTYVAAHGGRVNVNEIATHACDEGYAEMIVNTTPGNGPPYEWTMAFHAVSGNWQVIGSSDYIPPGSFGMPTSVGETLVNALQANQGGNEHVSF
jgi:hypothetical protein